VLEQEQRLQADLLNRQGQVGDTDAVMGQDRYNTNVHAAAFAFKSTAPNSPAGGKRYSQRRDTFVRPVEQWRCVTGVKAAWKP
jgi:hypothetical protein